MRYRPRAVAVGMCVIAALGAAPTAPAQPPEYPRAKTVDVVDEMRVVETLKVPDPYRWLEDGANPDVQAWTALQNALTRRRLDQFGPQREELARELNRLYSANIGSTPQIFGDRVFFVRRDGLQNHPVLYVREGGLDAEAKVAINPNTFSADGSVALDWWYPSPDGALVAYGKSAGGCELSTLYLRDVAAGADRELTIPHTRDATVVWDSDGGGFTYTRHPAPGSVPPGQELYHRAVFHHKLGDDPRRDKRLWQAPAEAAQTWADVYPSADGQYQFLLVEPGWTRNDLYIRRAGQPGFEPLVVGLNCLVRGDVQGEKLLLLTNYKAPRFRIVMTDLDNPAPDIWQDVVPQQKGVISEFVLVDGKLVVSVMENAYSRLLICAPDGQLIKEVELPALGTVSGIAGRPDRPDLLFTFESPTFPPVVFHYDLRAHTMRAIDRMEIGLPLENYETQQVWFNSKDGTRVPMFVTCKTGLELNGRNPTILTGYGGFNISLKPRFDRDIIPWIQRGGVWAVANIRGGGEFGQAWHLAGRLDKKQNSFDDFIAAADKLIADGYTSPQYLGASGSSNGGLLTGAMIVQRPELFRAIYCGVPLLDMLRYHLFSVAGYFVSEYGSSDNPEQVRFLYAYSPYHHVQAGVEYPAVLLTAAEGDIRVDAMHARKMAARLQAATASDRPILLWVEDQAGHARSLKPLSRRIGEQLDIWTFFMWQFGLFDQPTESQPAPQTAPGGQE